LFGDYTIYSFLQRDSRTPIPSARGHAGGRQADQPLTENENSFMSYLYWITVLGVGIFLAFACGLLFIAFFCYGVGFLITAVLLKYQKVTPGLHWGYSPLGQVIKGIGWIYWSLYTYKDYPSPFWFYILVLFLFIIAGSLAGYRAKKRIAM